MGRWEHRYLAWDRFHDPSTSLIGFNNGGLRLGLRHCRICLDNSAM